MTGETPGGGYCGYPVAGYCVTGAPQVVVCGGDAAKWIKNQLCFNFICVEPYSKNYHYSPGPSITKPTFLDAFCFRLMITTIDVMKNIDVAIEIAMTNASIAKKYKNSFWQEKHFN